MPLNKAFTDAFGVFDDSVDRHFDRLRGNRWADRIFYGASEAANHSLLWHGLTWITGFHSKAARGRAARISLILMAESVLINGPVKGLFRRERPIHEGKRPHRLRQPKTSSFPSGHATSAFCAAALLGHRSRLKPAFYITALVVASSRVYVRIHHASDILIGAGIGACVGALTKRLLGARPHKEQGLGKTGS